MSRALTTMARDELVQAVRERYRGGPREAKILILEEFAAISGYHRKSAIRILNGTPRPDDEARGRCRPLVYDEAVRQALILAPPPSKDDADWHEAVPRCMEMDVVAHCGDVARPAASSLRLSTGCARGCRSG